MKKETWKELPIGSVNLRTASSRENLTGTWRSGEKASFIVETCIQCFFCWLYCPHFAILHEEGKVTGVNYDYCTGCGLCESVCPTDPKSIVLIKEELTLAGGEEK